MKRSCESDGFGDGSDQVRMLSMKSGFEMWNKPALEPFNVRRESFVRGRITVDTREKD